jgi:hypothetical protein
MNRVIPVLLFAVLALAFSGACGGEPVGRICDLGVEAPGAMQAVVASPSLDCTTRTCLKVPKTNTNPPAGSRYPEGNKGLCTAECGSDDDCERVPESPCISGFTCGIPVTVGPFCCRKFCICKDYVVVPEDGLPEPAACIASNPANDCRNLEGRM